MNRRPERLADLLPGVVAHLAARHHATNGAPPMPDNDDELLAVRLTRAQWRAVKESIGEQPSGAHDVLWDALDRMPLADEPMGGAA